MNPLVSVVVPLHNSERYLRETIESILAQAHRPLEIIAVDDGSTDSTGEIARSFPHEIKLISQAQQGHPAARNTGIRAARGEFLAFLDHDDLWAPHKLELQLGCFRRDPDVDLVFGYMQNFFTPEMTAGERARISVPLYPLPGVLQGSMLARRGSFERVGLFHESQGTGDFLDWFGRANIAKLKIHMLSQTLVQRRIHATNYMRTHRHERQEYVYAVKRLLDRRRAAASAG